MLISIPQEASYSPIDLPPTHAPGQDEHFSDHLEPELPICDCTIELGIRDLKQHMGFGDCQLRSRVGIERHATMSVVGYTLLQLLPLLESVPFFPRWAGGDTPYPSIGQMRGQFQRAVLAHLILAWVGDEGLRGENQTDEEALEKVLELFPAMLPVV